MVVLPKNALRPRTVGRLSIYRRVLNQLLENGSVHIFSRDLAKLAGVSASQVRQDLMNVPACGTPQHGYSAIELLLSVNRCLGTTTRASTVLLGAGHLGQAILAHFQATQPDLDMKAVFEVDLALVGQRLHNITILPLTDLEHQLRLTKAKVAILAVPSNVAQILAEQLVNAGICSILNFTPIRLQLPQNVFVEDNDIQTSLERVAYYASAPMEQGVNA